MIQGKNYEDILNEVRQRLNSRLGVNFTYDPGSFASVLTELIAFEIYDIYTQMYRSLTGFTLDTASGELLDKRALEFGMERIKEVKAQGVVRFFISEDVVDQSGRALRDIYIPAGTFVSTDPFETGNPYRYILQKDILIQVGGNVSQDNNGNYVVDGICVAEKGGKEYNQDVGKVKVLAEVIPEVKKVENITPMGGGRDRETDEEFRRRIKAYWQSLTRGTVKSLEYAVSLANFEGKSVVSYDIVEDFLTATVLVYVDDGSGTLSQSFRQYTLTFTVPENGMIYFRLPHKSLVMGSVEVRVNNSSLSENQHYFVRYPSGLIRFNPPRSQGDSVEIKYRAYYGLIPKCQEIIDQYRPAGVYVYVVPANTVFMNVVVNARYVSLSRSLQEVESDIKSAITDYFLKLKVSENVQISGLVSAVMGVRDVYSADVIVNNTSSGEVVVNQGYLGRVGNIQVNLQLVSL